MVAWNFGMVHAAESKAGTEDTAKAGALVPTVVNSYRHCSASVGNAGTLATEPVDLLLVKATFTKIFLRQVAVKAAETIVCVRQKKQQQKQQQHQTQQKERQT